MTALINDSYIQTSGELSSQDSQLATSGVSANMVHRTHDRDVFVTCVRMVGPSHFEVSAQWPASHSFYGPVGDRHDPLLLVETVREAIFAVGHGKYDIPRDTSFIARDKEFQIDPAGLRTAGDRTVDVIVDITTTDIRRRGGAVAGMRYDAACYRDGMLVGTASYGVSFAPAPVYTRLRGKYRTAKPAIAWNTAPVLPSSVGRVDEIDVLLGEAPGVRGWNLRVDPAHPVIYDHIIDHVPGNAAVEAGRQAAYLATGRADATLVRGGMSFARYIEFDAPCLVFAEQTETRPDGGSTVVVAFTQNDQISAEGTFDLHLPLPVGA